MATLFEAIAQQPPLTLPPPSQGSKTSNLSFPKPKLTQEQHKSHSLHTQHYILDGPINSSTYASILESCKCLYVGKQVHAHAVKNGFHGHEFVDTKLLQMYGKRGCFSDATLLFDKMPVKNFGGVELGRQFHGIVIKNGFMSNIYVGNALIDMYGKCGSLDNAKKVLNTMPERDCVSWNSIATACAANGMVYEALEFLKKMSLEDKLTPNLVSWSAVIGGFSQNGYDEEAFEMLYRMQATGFEPNARMLASILSTCARLEKLSLGKEIHGYIVRHGFMSNPFVVNGLVDIYRRCADMVSATKIFSKFSVKNEVSYNTMIVG